MKRGYPALILLCLLLAGCSGKGEETTFPTQTEAVPVEAAPPAGSHRHRLCRCGPAGLRPG